MFIYSFIYLFAHFSVAVRMRTLCSRDPSVKRISLKQRLSSEVFTVLPPAGDSPRQPHCENGASNGLIRLVKRYPQDIISLAMIHETTATYIYTASSLMRNTESYLPAFGSFLLYFLLFNSFFYFSLIFFSPTLKSQGSLLFSKICFYSFPPLLFFFCCFFSLSFALHLSPPPY